MELLEIREKNPGIVCGSLVINVLGFSISVSSLSLKIIVAYEWYLYAMYRK